MLILMKVPVRRALSGTALSLIAVAAFGAALQPQTPGDFSDDRKLPEGLLGQRITQVLDTIAANDPAATRKLVEAAFTDEFRTAVPTDEHLAVFGQLYQSSRGFDFYGIRSYTTPRPQPGVVVILKNRLTGGWQGVTIDLEDGPQGRIAGLMFSPARPPKDAPVGPKLSEAEMIQELAATLRKLADADALSGAVLLARGDTLLLEFACGQACKSYDVPNRVDTKFNLGSMNKMFTAVAIAQLAEQGRLAYADPIAKFLGGDWIALDAAQRITIEHLLTHSSGLGSYFTDQFLAASRERFRVIDDYKPLVRGERPAFEPGSEWSYSNTGYLLLGAIIEKVTGGSYYDYVREHICSPAGMNDTDCYDMDKVVPNLAIGYTREPGASGQPEWTTNAFKHVIRGGPAGGGFSTVRDLHRFDRALRTGKLVSAKTTELMWSPKPASPQYGYGFGLEGAPGARIVGHSGGFPGISAKLNMYLDSGYTLAVLSNYDQGAMVVEQKVGELLARLK